MKQQSKQMSKLVLLDSYCQEEGTPIDSGSTLERAECDWRLHTELVRMEEDHVGPMPVCFCSLRHAMISRGAYLPAQHIIKLERARVDFDVTNCWSNIGEVLDPKFWKKIRLAEVNL